MNAIHAAGVVPLFTAIASGVGQLLACPASSSSPDRSLPRQTVPARIVEGVCHGEDKAALSVVGVTDVTGADEDRRLARVTQSV
ncbi:MAG TPA: hypothetical protein VF595_10515 [Tepidisphaeraceae bacterium]